MKMPSAVIELQNNKALARASSPKKKRNEDEASKTYSHQEEEKTPRTNINKTEKQVFQMKNTPSGIRRTMDTAIERPLQTMSSRLPFLKDVLLGEKEPSQNLLRESSSMVEVFCI